MILEVLKHPIVVASSVALVGYGLYTTQQLTQAGKAYEIGDLSGKTYIVTGATDGIGKALAETLAKKHARVIMACRDRNKCLEVRRDIVFDSKNKEVYCRICDMSDFDSIHKFASRILKGKNEIDRIDGIVHNAATVEPKRKVNTEGVELCLATNYMGPFLLTALLLQKLLDQPHPSRIVFVNNDIAAKDKIEIDLNTINDAKYTRKQKLDPEKGKYYGVDAYLYSKAMELCFSRELAERLKGSNVMVLSAYPGWTRTNLEKRVRFKTLHWITGRFLRRPEKAIKPILFSLVDENAKSGSFVGREMEDLPWGNNAENAELRQRIWAMSEHWTATLEHMKQMQKELELKNDYFGAPLVGTRDGKPKGRSWYWLWLK